MAEENKEVKTAPKAKTEAKKVIPKEAEITLTEKAPKAKAAPKAKTETAPKAEVASKAESVKTETTSKAKAEAAPKAEKQPKAEAAAPVKAEVQKQEKKAKPAGKKIKITLLRSTNNVSEKQKRTVQALGLKKIRSSVTREDNACIRGMIFVVKHMVKVENID